MTPEQLSETLAGLTYKPGTSVRVRPTYRAPDTDFPRYSYPGEPSNGYHVIVQRPVRMLVRKTFTHPAPPEWLQTGRDVRDVSLDDETREGLLNNIYLTLLQCETHELQETLRFNGRCVEDPHPEVKVYLQKSERQRTPGVPVCQSEYISAEAAKFLEPAPLPEQVVKVTFPPKDEGPSLRYIPPLPDAYYRQPSFKDLGIA